MYCRFCRREIANESSFCPYCGNRIHKQETIEKTNEDSNNIMTLNEKICLIFSGICMVLACMAFSKIPLFIGGGLAIVNIIYIHWFSKEVISKNKILITIISAFAFLVALVLILYIMILK